MNRNYPYPKNELEFYSRQYSIDQLVKNYNSEMLFEYYHFGMLALEKINIVIDNNMFKMVGETQFKVEQDKAYLIVRTNVVKKALELLLNCSVIPLNNGVTFVHNN